MNKDRADSSHVMTELAREATREILPPEVTPLEESEMPFWKAIIQARHTWTDVDLLHAANLARSFKKIEENTVMLRIEGDVLINAKGTPVMNPRFAVLEQLTRRAAALSQKLQVHAQATIGKPETNNKKNAAKQKIAQTFNDLDDDDLIARPN